MKHCELRQNPATKEWVVVAPEHRAFVPIKVEAKPAHDDQCPLCPGNEAMTPRELFRFPSDSSISDWQVRVVPGEFAGMKPDSLPSKHDGLFQRIPGFSHHEIVIGHPMHNIDINQMPVQHVFQLLTAYRTRQRELWRHKDVRYVTIFRSHGTSSGTSYGHPHSQILATAVVPGFIHNKHKIAQSYLATTQKNLYSEILEVEESSDRMIERNETMSVFVPFAALVPYEMWIMPRGRHPSFSQATDPDLEGLADTLHRSITRLKGCCGEVAYSYMIYSCPVGEEDPSFSWYLEIAPRLARPAGADLGPHTWVNPVPPEVCAENLRKISQVESQDLAEVDVLGLGLPKEVQ